MSDLQHFVSWFSSVWNMVDAGCYSVLLNVTEPLNFHWVLINTSHLAMTRQYQHKNIKRWKREITGDSPLANGAEIRTPRIDYGRLEILKVDRGSNTSSICPLDKTGMVSISPSLEIFFGITVILEEEKLSHLLKAVCTKYAWIARFESHV